MAKLKILTFISGRGSNFQAVHRHIVEKSLDAEIIAVLSDKKKAAGLKYAEEHNIPTIHVPRKAKEQSNEEFNLKLAEAVEPYSPDLIILAGFMRVLTSELISKYPNQIINIHPSLLPDFRGLNAQEQALEAGAKKAGCTVHYVVPEIDSGPILMQAEVPVLDGDTVDSLSDRILVEEHKILPAVVERFAKGELP